MRNKKKQANRCQNMVGWNGPEKVPLNKGDVTTRRAAPVAAGVTGGFKRLLIIEIFI